MALYNCQNAAANTADSTGGCAAVDSASAGSCGCAQENGSNACGASYDLLILASIVLLLIVLLN